MIEWRSQLDFAGKIGLETILTKLLIVVVDGEMRSRMFRRNFAAAEIETFLLVAQEPTEL